MEKNLSKKINVISSISCIFVVLIHAELFQVKLPTGILDTYGRNIGTIIQLLFSEGIGRTAVPLFFFISGLLFFQNYRLEKKVIIEKYKKIIIGYVIPYVIWSTLVFCFYYLLYLIPQTNTFVTTRDLSNLSIRKLINVILLNPIDSPLWFLRNLIIFTLFHPLLFLLVEDKRKGLITVVILFVTWLVSPNISFTGGCGLFYYIFGSYIGRHYIQKMPNLNKRLTILLVSFWILLLVYKCYKVSGLTSSYYSAAVGYGYCDKIFDKITIIVGCVSIWYMFDLPFLEKISLFIAKIKKYSFFIFVMHHPIIMGIKKIIAKTFGASQISIVLNYIISAFITIVIIIFISKVMEKIFPRLFRVLNGARKAKNN